MEMPRRSESRSLFIRVIYGVPCFQKGTINIVFSQSSSHLNSGPISCCGTPACTGNAPNRLGKTPKKQTASTKENNSLLASFSAFTSLYASVRKRALKLGFRLGRSRRS